MNTGRREFFKKLLTGGAAVALSTSWFKLLAEEDIEVLTIMHTNDTHSRIEPFPHNDPNYHGMGGYSRRAALISHFRQQAEHFLLVDAGDIFQGTPYFNIYKGEPELKLMSKMGYDAATMGNHEFDNGLDGFLEIMDYAKFPFITSNYDFSETILKGKTKPYKVLQKGVFKIGIYGLGIKLDGLVSPNLYKKTRYINPIEVAQETESILKNRYNCNLVICLSHLGYKYDNEQVSDALVAANTIHTDIIVGGHTHDVLDPVAKIKNSTGKPVYIGQAGYSGVKIGRMEVYFNKENQQILVETNTTKIQKNQVV